MSSIEQMAVHLPVGTATFMLTDVGGSTLLWESAPDATSAAIRRHYELLDTTIALHGGMRPQEQGEGDSVVAAFRCASDALAANLDRRRARQAVLADALKTAQELGINQLYQEVIATQAGLKDLWIFG